ncbi:MAG: hypothetical protein GX643_07405 [Acidimicrobiales bacterium]|nr:hypothetical protein [Acidimicrobiales bacterium]
MKWFLLWALGSAGVLIVAACLAFLFMRGRIRRRHRIDHKVQTGAPLAWLVDPRAPARMHRRLARVGSIVDAVVADHQPTGALRNVRRRPEPTPLVATATDLKNRAVETDRQLARVAVLAPAARRGPLAEIGHQVAQLETAATELSALSTSALTPSSLQHHLHEDVAAQVTRLAEAQRELDALDAEAGLRPSPTGGGTPAHG